MSTSRLQDESDFLKASIRIGSCKGPVNYKQAQTVFHHDDIPEAKRNRKVEVMKWKQSKILNIDNPSWNQSIVTEIPMLERRTMENYVHDRSRRYDYNFRGETLDYLRNMEPIDRPTKFHISRQQESTARSISSAMQSSRVNSGYLMRTEAMPQHPKLESAVGWNTSTATLSTKQMDNKLQSMTATARLKTAPKNAKLGSLLPYETPIATTANQLEKIRSQKRDGVFDAKLYLNR